MSVSVEEVKSVAHLARLGVNGVEIDGICGDLNRILRFVEQLNGVDCPDDNGKTECISGLRERIDLAEPCDQSVMDNAPQKACNMFVVPRLLEIVSANIQAKN